MAAMNMVSAVGFSGVSFHLRRCPQGVASVLCKKTPIFRSRRSKLDHLTVRLCCTARAVRAHSHEAIRSMEPWTIDVQMKKKKIVELRGELCISSFRISRSSPLKDERSTQEMQSKISRSQCRLKWSNSKSCCKVAVLHLFLN
jgi:hypothetical protein